MSVDELLTGVRIALGQLTVGDCFSMDADLNGTVDVTELLGAIDHVLTGSP